MANNSASCEQIMAGETASIENIHGSALSISLDGEDGCTIALELAPKQIMNVTAGQCNVQLILHGGDPSCLRIIKPETP